MTQATVIKTYSKTEMVAHFFKNAYSADDVFILLPGETNYQLVYEQTEQELERMMSRGKIVNYVTLEHILSVVSELDNFLSQDQLQRVASEIEDF